MSGLEKVIAPCDKKYVAWDELIRYCSAVYPVYLPEKFLQEEKYEVGALSVSNAENRKQLNLCLFKLCEDGRLELIQRVAFRNVHAKQLKSLIEMLE